MTHGDDISLFIGILPGADRRQIVLFPDGQVLADLREHEIATSGYAGSDQGMIAASRMIAIFRAAGWEIDETEHIGAVWMKPGERTRAGDSDEDSTGAALPAA